MADRSDVDIAKYIDGEVLSGLWMQGGESRRKAAMQKCPWKKAIASVEREHTGQVYTPVSLNVLIYHIIIVIVL